MSSLDEVKKAFRQLALLHHPDKPDGDGDTFKLVQEAYVVGMRRCAKHPSKIKVQPAESQGCTATQHTAPEQPTAKAKTKAKAKGKAPDKVRAKAKAKGKSKSSDVHAETKPEEPVRPPKRKAAWVLPPGASSAKIRRAVEQYEDSSDWDAKTMPDAVRAVTPQELAAWLREKSCIPVDVREPNAQSGVEIRDAVKLSYSQVVFSPEEAAPTITRLRADGKPIVLFSEQPGIMGTCGMVGGILLDVFGFDEHLVRRLEGGCVAWEEHLDADHSTAILVETLMMRLQRKRRSAAKRVAAENAMADSVGLPNPESSQAAVETPASNIDMDTNATGDTMIDEAQTTNSASAAESGANIEGSSDKNASDVQVAVESVESSNSVEEGIEPSKENGAVGVSISANNDVTKKDTCHEDGSDAMVEEPPISQSETSAEFLSATENQPYMHEKPDVHELSTASCDVSAVASADMCESSDELNTSGIEHNSPPQGAGDEIDFSAVHELSKVCDEKEKTVQLAELNAGGC